MPIVSLPLSFSESSRTPQLIVFTAHNVVPRKDREGWALLRCLRSYAIVDLYLAFEAHTDQTLAAGRHELSKFAQLMQVQLPLYTAFEGNIDSDLQEYIKLSTDSSTGRGETPKNWNFPKMHALVHSFDDIEAKGASRNFNTKPNEKLHGPLKKAYLTRTNFKDVASQVWFYGRIILTLTDSETSLDLKNRAPDVHHATPS
jgi:hypothetical protein